MAARSKMAVG